MATHGFGIIGCGMIAEFHTRAIDEIEGARVVAAFDVVPGRAAKIAKLAGEDCRVYDDMDRMLADPRVDVVCVCTPSGAHRDPSVAAANAGKHVVVEKPLEITLPRCDAIIGACRRQRRPPLRHLPVAVLGGERRAEAGDRRGPVRPPDPGRHLRQVVADPGILRLGRLAGHLAARRRRRADEPGDPQRRPAPMADGRCRERSRR